MPEINKNFKVKENSSGVLIDIDGVVLQGGKPFEYSKDSIQKLWTNNVPFAFLTNGTYTSETITKSLSSIFDLPFTKDHIIVAPSPCLALTQYHDQNVLVCCQDDAIDLISE
jgi:ribonucleotide monophosphatase NagD (HAD superfamily)